jgi:aminopeptidase N
MWFGNLVTVKWWNDIWLNEGFAKYAEFQILSQLRPKYNCWQKYNKTSFKLAITLDSKKEITHPVQLDVPTADKLIDIFDTITY